jgi:glycosyltransferase involved in cell wall biosynthesis
VPPGISGRLRLRATGRLWTALGLPCLVHARLRAIRTFLEAVDAIVVPCDWASDLLERNAVPAGKVFRCRQGLRLPREVHRSRVSERSGPVRFVFVGRAHPDKGLSVVLDALRARPELNALLAAYVVTQAGDEPHLAALRSRVGSDPRIRLLPPIWDRTALLSELARHDCLVVPSVWLETGPMVALEAWAAGLPVIGSRLGGLAELIHDGVDGLLVEPGDVQAWRRCLETLVASRSYLATLQVAVRRPRSMATVAEEMSWLYERLGAEV